MRLVSLQELDYNDITHNIPHALIFGALEPSVGIILSCLPLLRPLLGRSKYSSDGTAGYSGSHDLPSNPVRSGNALKSNGFAELDDDSSQYRLRPLGPKHTVAVGNKATDRSSDLSDEQSLNNEEDRSGIVVKQHWSVS
jgi:hypothetical protein